MTTKEGLTSSHTTLTLTTPSLRNVTISTRSDDIFYEVTTPPWEPDITKVRRRDPEYGQWDLVGEIKNDIGGVVGDDDEDAASDDTRVGWGSGGKGKRKDKGKGKARKEDEDEGGERRVKREGKVGKKRGKPVEVRVWGGLYRDVEEWLPRAEGRDKVYALSRLFESRSRI